MECVVVAVLLLSPGRGGGEGCRIPRGPRKRRRQRLKARLSFVRGRRKETLGGVGGAKRGGLIKFCVLRRFCFERGEEALELQVGLGERGEEGPSLLTGGIWADTF